jgi:hypothetical protein
MGHEHCLMLLKKDLARFGPREEMLPEVTISLKGICELLDLKKITFHFNSYLFVLDV